jgi:hypothetical protein
MKPITNRFNHQFTITGARAVAAAALVASFALAPVMAFAADKDANEDRAELRIKDMHAKLQITPAQEPQWEQVATVMRDDAKSMDTLTQSRFDHAKDMSAVDDLKSYGDIATAHAEGIKKLTPVFATLYSSMSDDQQKEADLLFRHGPKKHVHHG